MRIAYWSSWNPVLAVLIGLTCLVTGPVRGQNNQPVKVSGSAELLAQTLTNAQVPDQVWSQILVGQLVDPADELLGATLQPVSEALRAQLAVPAGQGVVVASLRGDGPSAQAGLKQNDILLMLGDQPLASAEDLTKHLKANGEAAAPLKILRAGKPLTLQVRPIYKVTLGAAEAPKPEYYLGVSIEPTDEALRAQLDLPAGRGVLVLDVINGSPAEKAGIKKHDVLLELGDKVIDNPQTLTAQVQASKDKSSTVKLLREGKPLALPITGAVRKAQATPPAEAARLWLMDQPVRTNPAINAGYILDYGRNATSNRADGVTQRLEQLERELKALRRLEEVEKEIKALNSAVENVNKLLKANKTQK